MSHLRRFCNSYTARLISGEIDRCERVAVCKNNIACMICGGSVCIGALYFYMLDSGV